jgi:hypothetical protein
MKNITTNQIEELLKVIYQTNISAMQFDVIKKFFNELPVVKEDKKDEPTRKP